MRSQLACSCMSLRYSPLSSVAFNSNSRSFDCSRVSSALNASRSVVSCSIREIISWSSVWIIEMRLSLEERSIRRAAMTSSFSWSSLRSAALEASDNWSSCRIDCITFSIFSWDSFPRSFSSITSRSWTSPRSWARSASFSERHLNAAFLSSVSWRNRLS